MRRRRVNIFVSSIYTLGFGSAGAAPAYRSGIRIVLRTGWFRRRTKDCADLPGEKTGLPESIRIAAYPK